MNLSFRRCDVGWGLPCPRRQGLATAALFESERRFIDVENRFHLLAVVDRHFPEAHDLTHDLGVVTLRFGFVIDVADIVADTLFLFLSPLDALAETANFFVVSGGFAPTRQSVVQGKSVSVRVDIGGSRT